MPPGEEERESFISELETFIGQLLKMVEVELKFDYETINKISGQVHGEWRPVAKLANGYNLFYLGY